MTHPVLVEEAAWDEVVTDHLGPGPELVSVSRWIADARTYRRGDRVLKVRSLRPELPGGVSRFTTEAELMRQAGRPASASTSGDRWELLETAWLDGTSLDRADPDVAVRRAAIRRSWAAARRLHRSGIAHRDLRLDNIVLDAAGGAHLIDLGRAITASPTKAWLADALGLGLAPVASPLWRLALDLEAPRLVNLGRRLRDQLAPRRIVAPDSAPPDIHALVDAWRLAADSPANAPGHRLAYYALTYRDVHLVGERPWYLRWQWIRSAIDFRGLRLVELGCNMGLLSTFAVIHGAAGAMGIDHDSQIVGSARKVAAAFGVNPQFEVADVMLPGWESMVGDGDIVAAMSIVHWLPDPSRVLAYLARQPRVLFEGHQTTDVEVERLRSLGFSRVRVLGITERGRAIMLAERS